MKKEIKKERILSVEGRNGIGGAGYHDPGIGMKWYKFLVIILIVDAFVGVYDAVMYITGLVHPAEENGTTLWVRFPTTKILDIVYGIAIICRVAYQVYVWWQLKSKSRKTRILLMVMYVISYASSAVYLTAFGYSVNDFEAVRFGVTTNIVTGIVLTSLTHVYFSKREDIFVN